MRTTSNFFRNIITMLFFLLLIQQVRSQDNEVPYEVTFNADYNKVAGKPHLPECWVAWNGLNALTDVPFEGARYLGQSATAQPKVQVYTCFFNATPADTFSFYYNTRRGASAPGTVAQLFPFVGIFNYGDDDILSDVTWIDTLTFAAGNTWYHFKGNFKYNGIQKIVIYADASSPYSNWISNSEIGFRMDYFRTSATSAYNAEPKVSISLISGSSSNCQNESRTFRADTILNESSDFWLRWFINGVAKKTTTNRNDTTFTPAGLFANDVVTCATKGYIACGSTEVPTEVYDTSNAFNLSPCSKVTITSKSTSTVCQKAGFTINYSTSDTSNWPPGTTVEAELSDLNTKTWLSPTIVATGGEVGNLSTDIKSLSATVPVSLASGKYYIRLKATNDTISNNIDSITINPLPDTSGTFIESIPSCGSDSGGVVIKNSKSSVLYDLHRLDMTDYVTAAKTGNGGDLSIKFPPTTVKLLINAKINATGCNFYLKDTANIQSFAKPVVNSNTISIKHGTDTTLSVTVNFGVTPYTYQWSPKDSLLSNNDTIAQPRTRQLYAAQTFSVTATDNNKCPATGSVNISLSTGALSIPSINVSPVSKAICPGESARIIATASGGSEVYTYSWKSNPAGFTSTNDTINVSPTDTTWYVITLNDGYNSKKDSVRIFVKPVPVKSLTVVGDTICQGATGQIKVLNSISNVSYQLRLDVNNSAVGSAQTGTGGTLSFNATPSKDTLYNILATDPVTTCSAELTATAKMKVNINPLAQGLIISNLYNTDTVLNVNVSLGSGSFSYLWTPADSLVSGQQILKTPTTQKIKNTLTFFVTVTDNVTTCTDTAKTIVQSYGGPLIIKAYTNKSTICLGEQVALTSTSSGGGGISKYVYSWTSVPAGFTSAKKDTSIYPNVTRKYKLQLFDGNNYAYDSVSVTVNPLPVANAGQDDTVCNSENVLLTATGGTAYLWSDSSATASITIALPDSNTYLTDTILYRVRVTNSYGCTDWDSLTIFSKASPVAFAGTDFTIEYNQDTTLNGSASGASGKYTYLWSPSSLLVSNIVKNPNTIALKEDTTFTLLVRDDSTLCTSTDMVRITISGIPLNVIIDPDGSMNNLNIMKEPIDNKDTVICKGDTVRLNAKASGGIKPYTYNWFSDIGGFSSYDSVVFVAPTLKIRYIVKVTDATFTSAYDTIMISEKDIPFPSANPVDTFIFTNSAVRLSADGGDTYLWSPASLLADAPDVQNPMTKPLTSETFFALTVAKYYASDSITCYSTDTVHIRMKDFEVFVPEAFTPNGDDYNSELCVRAIGVSEIDFRVFNRWGEEIFKTTDINECWDGTYKGKEQHVQTYVYVLIVKDSKGEEFRYQGLVNLLR